jgi:hypothetical protein
MKLIIALLGLSLCAQAQWLGEITDAPQHVVAAGVGIGPTRADVAAYAGLGERLPGMAATYSWTGVSVVPSLQDLGNGSRALRINPVVHSGIKQIVFQRDRLSVAVDGGAGAALPSTGTSAFNFSAVGGVDLAYRLNRWSGNTNHYLTISPRVTQTPYGPVVSVGIGWAIGSR